MRKPRRGPGLEFRTAPGKPGARKDRQNAKFAVILAERGVPGV